MDDFHKHILLTSDSNVEIKDLIINPTPPPIDDPMTVKFLYEINKDELDPELYYFKLSTVSLRNQYHIRIRYNNFTYLQTPTVSIINIIQKPNVKILVIQLQVLWDFLFKLYEICKQKVLVPSYFVNSIMNTFCGSEFIYCGISHTVDIYSRDLQTKYDVSYLKPGQDVSLLIDLSWIQCTEFEIKPFIKIMQIKIFERKNENFLQYPNWDMTV